MDSHMKDNKGGVTRAGWSSLKVLSLDSVLQHQLVG